jgi:ribosomal protein S27AE
MANAGGNSMAGFYPIRKACPACGKPMLAVPDDVAEGRLRYVCTVCDQDPLYDTTARNWADGPLRPPAN